MTPEQFIQKWRHVELSERAAAQEHFLDLCDLLEVEKPAKVDAKGKSFAFEKAVPKARGGRGFADVWKKGCFAWEYKKDNRTLIAAYSQLKDYADALENPPLLIVSDMKEIRIHTNFTNAVAQVHVVDLPSLRSPEKLRLLHWAFTDPEQLRPTQTRAAVTEEAARAFAGLAQRLRAREYEPKRVAHFLNKLVFCMFVEDIGLLPDRVFAEIAEQSKEDPDHFTSALTDLFAAMHSEKGHFGAKRIPSFNGGLFDDDDVLPLTFSDIQTFLVPATRLDWAAIEPSIFGTLFEKGLDPERRKEMASLFDDEPVPNPQPRLFSQKAEDRGVGIHYTHPDTIMKIIEPVILRPLREEWEALKVQIADRASPQREARFRQFRNRLGDIRVLDPACGSGNFLYLALSHLKDFDLAVAREGEQLGFKPDEQRITPDSVIGIEINPYAAELARVTIWIGEIQWQIRNGFNIKRRPVLGVLDGIACRDAIMSTDAWEASWPDAEFIVGNPPFLGNKKMIGALGGAYVERLRKAFEDRVPGGADLVCYWFEKARAMIESGRAKRVGLVATNSIRGGASRDVLERIRSTGAIFEAWSDEPWVVEGAAVRVSLVCFSKGGSEALPRVDGESVMEIFADLRGRSVQTNDSFDLTIAKSLEENLHVAFNGVSKKGKFELDEMIARQYLSSSGNPNGRPNSDVILPWMNGDDLTGRPRGRWIVDFGERSLQEATQYEKPFKWVAEHVKPARDRSRAEHERRNWWLLARRAPAMRDALAKLPRFIATPEVSKHRLFVWLPSSMLPDKNLVAIAREDEASFGVLHSRFHAVWALLKGTSLEDRPRYTSTTVFRTFPFPEGLTPNLPAKKYASDSRALAIAAMSKHLNELREAWLNPPEWVRREPEVVPGFPDRLIPKSKTAAQALKTRTLTKLYNERPQWLVDAHRALDEAVAAAYGWPAALSNDEILANLLALNLERATRSARA